jgi:hypothetical protein
MSQRVDSVASSNRTTRQGCLPVVDSERQRRTRIRRLVRAGRSSRTEVLGHRSRPMNVRIRVLAFVCRERSARTRVPPRRSSPMKGRTRVLGFVCRERSLGSRIQNFVHLERSGGFESSVLFAVNETGESSLRICSVPRRRGLEHRLRVQDEIQTGRPIRACEHGSKQPVVRGDETV